MMAEALKSRDTWRCLVDKDGRIEELEDRTGADYIKAFDPVVRYAQALLFSERDHLAFCYAGHESKWYRVIVHRNAVAHGRQFSSVQMQLVDPAFGMTMRELDILTLLAGGLSNENIAARLAISMRTVAKHVENLFGKTQLFSRTALASYAVDKGLFRLPTPGGCAGRTIGATEIEQIADRLSISKEPERHIQRIGTSVLRPIMIGIPYVEEGPGAADSIELLNGSELAISEINQRGGVLGRTVMIAPVGFKSGNETSAREAYVKLIEAEVDAISAGYACYSPAVHDVVGEARLPYLHAATMGSAVERVRDSGPRLRNIFQTCASDINYGLGLVRFVRQMQHGTSLCARGRRLAIVQPTSRMIDIGIDRIEAGLARNGWQVDVVDVAHDAPDSWSKAIEALHRLAPSIIVVSSFFVEDAIAFQRAFVRSPLPAIIYNIYAPSVPQFRQELGESSEGIVWATTSGLYSDRIGGAFRDRYQTQFDVMPGSSQAGLAYDRVNLLVGAWMRTGHPRIFKEVLTGIRSSISRGVNGAYHFGNDGQVGLAYPDDTTDLSISQAHLVFQVQKGRNVIIGPAPFAQARMCIPPWF
ncbi:ABC transporter substrate-binding protein [Rhizobium sp. P38BS-XIX]|uniref:ABC transporter substrate-binding protein n=1 Tax=Rhizobium sp. P38BS-XIX TaxID=2726740 RepID=UPI0014571A7D|nr:ABC transporter substrate-binding protein [Rhizobium sp. P38BS-XIX]NLR99892.1 ABC transporter substrate-binding protein [Rhizobium sp. P38BS-XIX]